MGKIMRNGNTYGAGGGGTTYTAGTGIEITDQDVINAKVVTLTQAEYDALVQQEEVDLEAVYYISDGVAPNTAVTDVKMNNVSVVTDHVANIPLVSSSTNGVVPQGTAVSTQSQSTKFLREDGTWQVPSYTDDSDKVSKSGDTMTGDLNINVTNAKTKYINPNMTLDTSANNGLSSDSGYGAYFTDKNGNAVGDISMTTRSTGANYVQLMARNKKTDGTAVANYIDVIAAKDGSSSYYVSNPAEFRHAIGLNVTQTTTGTNGGVLRKCGNVVQLKFDNALVTNRGSITSDYRPSARILTNCVLKKISTNKWYAGMISIDTTGGFTIYYMNATDGNITDITKNSDWSISVSVTYIN